MATTQAAPGVPPVIARRATLERFKRPVIVRSLLIALAVVLWYVSTRVGLVDPVFVSSPEDVVSAAGDVFGVDTVQHAFAVTGKAIGLAFVIGTAAGVAGGLIVGLSRLIRDAYYGPILFIMATPKAIFVPIFLVLFGTDHTALAFGSFEAFFYVCVNVVGGVDLVEQRHRTVARAYGARPWHTFTDVLLPAAMPGVFAGIWYGIKHAFLAVVIAELYISAGGLGQVIRQYTNQLETDKVLAMIFAISILAVLVGVAWTRLENRLARWRDERTAASTVLP
jgi:ABC-type nitrate/sulfonate/bicarbonate transport system permease component